MLASPASPHPTPSAIAVKDGRRDEADPPVYMLAIREAGPYAVHAPIVLDAEPAGFRTMLHRCGASGNKPFCDSFHHDTSFAASGESATGSAEALAVRNWKLAIDPQIEGPLQVRGNLETLAARGAWSPTSSTRA